VPDRGRTAAEITMGGMVPARFRPRPTRCGPGAAARRELRLVGLSAPSPDRAVPYWRMIGAADRGQPRGRLGHARPSAEFGGGQPARRPPAASELVPLLSVEAEDAQRRERGDGTDVGDGGLGEVQPHKVRQTGERGDRDRFGVAAER
jgi:hypothetical protein